MSRSNCERFRREAAIAEGKKLLMTRGSGVEPQKPTRFLTFYAKMEYIFECVNLIFFSNEIEKNSR